MTGGWRLEVVPGPGTVLRHGSVAVWAAPSSSPALLDFLDRSCRNLAPSPRGGRLLASHVAAVLGERDPEPTAAFATVGPDGEGAWAVLLHGDAQLWDGVTWHRTPAPPGWVQHMAATTGAVLVGALGARPDPGGSHPLLDLESGAVPGGGFALVPARPAGFGPGSPPAPTATATAAPGTAAPSTAVAGPVGTAPAPPLDPHRPEEASLLTPLGGDPTVQLGRDLTTVLPAAEGGDETATLPATPPGTVASEGVTLPPPATPGPPPPESDRPPAAAAGDRPAGVLSVVAPPPGASPLTPSGPTAAVPVVRGVRCPVGHFNHPGATSCARCDRPIETRDAVVSGPRPPLGVLVVDDGGIWRLDRTYLLGARPDRDPTVTGGIARGLPLPGERVADAHAELRLGDWAVNLVDRGTPGGTWVLGPGAASWQRLEAYRQHLLRPGSHVAVGARVLTYLSPWPG